MTKRILTIIGIIWISCTTNASAVSGDTPAIIVSEKNYNFGELSEKTPVIREFIVKNGGKATLDIKDVQPS